VKVKKDLKSGITEITRESCLRSEGFNSDVKKERTKERKKNKERK
jgi:hypothetical protein